MQTQHMALVSMTSEQEGRVANELNRAGFADRDWWPSDVRVVLETIVKVLEFDAAMAADADELRLT